MHHNYDVASRLTSLTVDGSTHASQLVYNAASQTTSLSVGASGPNQIIECYNYEAQTGLLANQTVSRSSAPTDYLLDLSYDYAGANGKRTGQLVKLLNNKNHNKDRSYSYDALGRLVQAKGGPSTGAPLWTQTYTYDNFGNRTSVSASGYSAKLNTPDPQSAIGNRQLAMTTGSAGVPPATPRRSLGAVDESSASERQSLSAQQAAEPQRSSHHASRPTATTPQSSPPTFTDPDLLAAGGILIQALHITELRTAINDLRAQRGFAAYSWQTSVTGLIKADPILEMRTALDQALGPPPSPGYSAGLAQGQPILAIHIQELRNRVVNAWNAPVQIPVDGHANLSYDTTTNRITTSGFAYDKAGNQVRALIPGSSSSQRFQYDAANRLVKVKAEDNVTVLASYTYGDTNERLSVDEGGLRTYYACDGKVEYTESGSSTSPAWSKSYVYLGARLLSTLTPNGSGGEFVQYHHPDRLGTRLVSNAQDTTSFEQVTLPFGTALNAESTGSTNRRFTTYDRSANTGLDYAMNRHYDALQGRFTQVDPISMDSVNLYSPQTLNLYAYCSNDPINQIDPSGLGFLSFFAKLFKAIGKIIKILAVVLVVVVVVALVIAYVAPAGSLAIKFAKFLLFKLAPVLAKTLAGLSGAQTGSITAGLGGTPPWNPNARYRGFGGLHWELCSCLAG